MKKQLAELLTVDMKDDLKRAKMVAFMCKRFTQAKLSQMNDDLETLIKAQPNQIDTHYKFVRYINGARV